MLTEPHRTGPHGSWGHTWPPAQADGTGIRSRKAEGVFRRHHPTASSGLEGRPGTGTWPEHLFRWEEGLRQNPQDEGRRPRLGDLSPFRGLRNRMEWSKGAHRECSRRGCGGSRLAKTREEPSSHTAGVGGSEGHAGGWVVSSWTVGSGPPTPSYTDARPCRPTARLTLEGKIPGGPSLKVFPDFDSSCCRKCLCQILALRGPTVMSTPTSVHFTQSLKLGGCSVFLNIKHEV